MGSYPGSMHDPDIDGRMKLPPKPVPMTRVPRLLAVVAFMSVAWAAVSIVLFLRAERSRRQGHDRLSSPEAPSSSRGASPASTARVSASRPLLALVPDSIRDKGLPGSQISLAADVRAAEQLSGASIRRSLEATGPRPDGAQMAAQMAALEGLKLHAQPGRKIEGWLMQVGWPFRIDEGNDPKYIFTRGPPGYRVTLRFPETLAGYEIWLSGYNYDSRAKEFACADRYFEAIKLNDWVRVSGVLRPGSRMEWEFGKPDQFLSLGEMTISDIRRVEVVQK